MRKYILTTFIIIAAIAAHGQKERNQWCFGDGAGLDFNSGSPVIFNTAIFTTEGCSSIADSGGKLLFYTDGVTVWNKNNIAMPNGFGLDGGGSTTQSALIVKEPGSASIYYVFYMAEAQGPSGFRYSTVDITLAGGLGDVVAKNVAVQSNMSEKLCGVYHANGTDVWIMVHPLNSNGFYAYLLTSSGLNITPVISYTGTVHGTGSGDETGYMKFSGDSKKIACAVRYQYFYELFDFDNATGVVANPIHFTASTRCYGVEFSPDNSKIYFTDDNYLSQADLSSGDSATIAASMTTIYAGIPWAPQLAPDGKIYIAMYSNYLSVINNPNAAGLACGFVNNAFNLGSVGSELGLPNMIPTFTGVSIPPPVAALQSSDSNICVNDCISFTDKSTNNPTSWLWTFQGALPSSSTEQNPGTVCYISSGSFNVTLTVTNAGGSNSITLTNLILADSAPPIPIISQFDSLLYCSKNPDYVSYQWFDSTMLIPGATDTFIVATHRGNYNLQVKNRNGCTVAVGINIILGINNPAAIANSISFYPNPAGNKLRIRTADFGNQSIDIYNAIGERALPTVVMEGGGQETEIDIRKLSAGVYFLDLRNEKERRIAKFIKE